MPPFNIRRIGRCVRKFYEDEERQRRFKSMPLAVLERHYTAGAADLTNLKEKSGLERLALIDWVLHEGLDSERKDLEWSKFQREVFSLMKRVCVPQLVPGLSVYASRLKRENGWPDFRTFMLITTARQMGKTTSMCAFICALAIVLPNACIRIFTTCLNLSTENLKKVVNNLKKVMEKNVLDIKIVTENAQLLEFIGPDGTLKRVFAHASNPDTLRYVKTVCFFIFATRLSPPCFLSH